MVVRIIGADHRIQWIPQLPGLGWISRIAEFTQYLKVQCADHMIQLIGEEFSEYLVQSNHAQDSTARRTAKEIGCSHLFCDPDSGERVALGIRDNFDRESEWLRRLAASGFQRILFICGEDHADTFAVRLQDAGYDAQVVGRNWGRGWETVN